VWRLQKDKAGSGALGDIGAHVIDLAQHVTGSAITSVTGLTPTFVTERPLPADGPTTGLQASAGEGGPAATGTVTVDDAALFLTRFDSGAVGSFEATRFATGRKNTIRLEVNGSEGSLVFDFEFMNELQFHDRNEDPETAGFRRIMVTEPSHPYVGAWWPPGHGLGYEHTFTHEVVDLVSAIGREEDPVPSFADGLQVQQVLAAVERSAAAGTWQDVHTSDRSAR
jgi:predicted dehydrogenase